jgi:hypothetical protein
VLRQCRRAAIVCEMSSQVKRCFTCQYYAGERLGKTNGLLEPPPRLRASAGNHSSRAPLPAPPARRGNPIRVACSKVQRGKARHGQADQESGGLCLNVVHNRAEGRNFQPPLAAPGHMSYRRSSCMCIPYRGDSDGANKWLCISYPPVHHVVVCTLCACYPWNLLKCRNQMDFPRAVSRIFRRPLSTNVLKGLWHSDRSGG